MRSLLVVTDAWHPQINGVVTSLDRLACELRDIGMRVEFITPLSFKSIPMPSYGEIRLSLTAPAVVRRFMERYACDHLHIATEGPLGLMARSVALKTGRVFTTSYHTRFPEYVRARFPVPLSFSYAWLKRFHNAGQGCMVATQTLDHDLSSWGFRGLMRWSRGVDHTRFRPMKTRVFSDLVGPVFLYVGRVAVEKNIAAFLELDLPGTKVVVGGGPQLDELRQRYQQVRFTGPKQGDDLAACYAGADVFIFPSLTDTFGNVLLEAMASGTPVAAYPVMGPIDVIGDSRAGVLDNDLRTAALKALDINREHCRNVAHGFTWRASAEQFLQNAKKAYQLPSNLEKPRGLDASNSTALHP
ncbi:glycosyltransferase family 4 protein [Pseudovibrio brasiliensis]|uniref:Glycosyltransferase family 1 protein n=1 Tax=Pseudovibrio brasiliensis TaxID=1898042 RepID=A0ABX8AVT0_9HYPH|nr:glycosyltransferase family 1 protein [Pseudovibrio brasiliensis]QUS59159.1 glycosyltransferase family 1 protein [Pseudovibrio brasiliensis]